MMRKERLRERERGERQITRRKRENSLSTWPYVTFSRQLANLDIYQLLVCGISLLLSTKRNVPWLLIIA